MLDIVLRDEKNQLCINYTDESIGFTVITEDNKQLDFSLEIDDWVHLKSFIDGQINKPVMRNGKI